MNAPVSSHQPSLDRLARYVAFDQVNRPYIEWQIEQFSSCLGQRLLEIGCGVGGVIDLLGHRELIVGVDIDDEVLSYARRRFADRPNHRFALLDVGKIADNRLRELTEYRFDTLLCINVLEHIEGDLRALRTMQELLIPGGALALLVPAHQALYGRYDAMDGHYRRYNREQLTRLIRQTDLRIERLHYFNIVGAAGWWVQYRLLRRAAHGKAQFGLMTRLLPLIRSVERRLNPPFGLSLVAVCRKPADAPGMRQGTDDSTQPSSG